MAPISKSSPKSEGKSFRLCTATSISFLIRDSSSSLVKTPLSVKGLSPLENSESFVSLCLSPLVWIIFSTISPS